jgi:uncharacterized protein YdhG (YjbR/CyaY superfamily)
VKAKPVTTVDEYIAAFPKEVQQLLSQMRKTIKAAAPKAQELISYGMPGYKYHGMLVYFSGFAKHIGFYAVPSGHAAFKKELAGYKQGKGSVQFPLDKPLPLALVKKIVQFRVKENEAKAVAKAKTLTPVKPPKPTGAVVIEDYMAKLKYPLKAEAETLRAIIKKAGKKLSERIKWNAPSYYYKEDILTFNFGDPKCIRIIFHHPSVIKIKSPLLEGNYKDRRIVYLKDANAIKTNKKELENIIQQSIALLDK